MIQILVFILSVFIPHIGFAIANSPSTVAFVVSHNNSNIGSCHVDSDGNFNKCKLETYAAWSPQNITLNHAGTYAYIGSDSLSICPIHTDKSLGTCIKAADPAIHKVTAVAINADDSNIYIASFKIIKEKYYESYLTSCHLNSDGMPTECAYIESLKEKGLIKALLIHPVNQHLYIFDDSNNTITCAISGDNSLSQCTLTYRGINGVFNTFNQELYIADTNIIYIPTINPDGTFSSAKEILNYGNEFNPFNKIFLSKEKDTLYISDHFYHRLFSCPLGRDDTLGTCKLIVKGTGYQHTFTNPTFYATHSNKGVFALRTNGSLSFFNIVNGIPDKFGYLTEQNPIKRPRDYDLTQPMAMATNHDDSRVYFSTQKSTRLTYCQLHENSKLSNCMETGNDFNTATNIVIDPSEKGLYATNSGDGKNPNLSYCPLNSDGGLGQCRSLMKGNYTVHFSKKGKSVYLAHDNKIESCEIDTDHNFMNCKLFDVSETEDPSFYFNLINDGSGVYMSYRDGRYTGHQFCEIKPDGSKGNCTKLYGLYLDHKLVLSQDNTVAYIQGSETFGIYRVNLDHTLSYIGMGIDIFHTLSDIVML